MSVGGAANHWLLCSNGPSRMARHFATKVADPLLDVRVVHEAAALVERGPALVGDVDNQIDGVTAERERSLSREHQ